MSSERHALVVGSSVSGLLATWILSQHFDRVTIIERDQLPDEAEYRSGVPQGRHLHVLLAKGHEVFAQLFPTFEDDLGAMGVASIDIGLDAAFRTAGGWSKRTKSGVITNPVSRVTVDYYLRQQLKKRDNIDYMPQTEVEGYVMEGQRISGVEVSSRSDHSTRTITADLVVDASGRGSKTPELLKGLGYEAPRQTVVNSYLGYATRWYKLPPGQHFDWHIILIAAVVGSPKLSGGAAQIVEDGRLVLTLGGVNKYYPPTEEAGFMEFVRNLPSPVLYEVVKDLEPDSPIYGYRRTENVWNHYEKLPRFPEGLLVTGDAYCGFNPIYGQGMTVAAMEAQKLDELLRQQSGTTQGLPALWFKALAQVIENPWLLATGEDLRYPGTDGDRPGAAARLVQKYIDQLVKVCPLDSDLAIALSKVTNLLEPPAYLLQPRFAVKVLGYMLQGAKADESMNMPQTQLQSAAGD